MSQTIYTTTANVASYSLKLNAPVLVDRWRS